jgi:hypothetical protein
MSLRLLRPELAGNAYAREIDLGGTTCSTILPSSASMESSSIHGCDSVNSCG